MDKGTCVNPGGHILVDTEKMLKVPIDACYPVLRADYEHALIERIKDSREGKGIATQGGAFVCQPGFTFVVLSKIFIQSG